MSQVAEYLRDRIETVAAAMPVVDKFDILADAGLEDSIRKYTLTQHGATKSHCYIRAIDWAFSDALMSGVKPDRIYWPTFFRVLGRTDARWVLGLEDSQ